MKPLALEWVEKAEGDFTTARRELRARRAPNYDASCFHAQQTAEKYLKAILQEHDQVIPHTHNLIDLLALCLKIDPMLTLIRPDLERLSRYAVRFRYPGETADKTEARLACKSAEMVRQFFRERLGIS